MLGDAILAANMRLRSRLMVEGLILRDFEPDSEVSESRVKL